MAISPAVVILPNHKVVSVTFVLMYGQSSIALLQHNNSCGLPSSKTSDFLLSVTHDKVLKIPGLLSAHCECSDTARDTDDVRSINTGLKVCYSHIRLTLADKSAVDGYFGASFLQNLDT
jgi:hypothetical protein